jgi:TRAP-type C4-dicarboxylate transport system substrate-binding protein
MWSNFWVVANFDAFHALPPDLRRILRDAVNEYALTDRSEMALRNDSLAEKLTRLGMRINKVETAPFRAKLEGFYRKEKSDFGNEAWTLLENSVGTLG